MTVTLYTDIGYDLKEGEYFSLFILSLLLKRYVFYFSSGPNGAGMLIALMFITCVCRMV